MSTTQLRELADSASVVGLTLDQYIRMIETGILPEGEPIELLDGFLVRKDRAKAGEDPRTIGFDHIWAVDNLPEVLAEVRRLGYYVRLQQPVALPPDGAPEPDGAIARGTRDDYLSCYPAAADVPCIIEVADSSLQHDRITKLRSYAEGGVPQYVIINLVNRQIEVFEQPDMARGIYLKEQERRGHEIVEFILPQQCIGVEARKLLPPT
jgi:Uma2 family endonuclease